jgi:uncharacterized protein (TIGR03435 family)
VDTERFDVRPANSSFRRSDGPRRAARHARACSPSGSSWPCTTNVAIEPVYALVMAHAPMPGRGRGRQAAQVVRSRRAKAIFRRKRRTQSACSARVGPGRARRRDDRSQLRNLLPRFVDRVVLDRTGLAGRFDLDLEWTPAPGEWVNANCSAAAG